MNTRQYRLGLAAIVVPAAAGIGGIAAAIVMSTSGGTSTPRQPVQVVANVSTAASITPAPSTSAPVKAAPKPAVAKPLTSVYVPPATSQAPVQRAAVPADVPVDPTTIDPAPATTPVLPIPAQTTPAWADTCQAAPDGSWQCWNTKHLTPSATPSP